MTEKRYNHRIVGRQTLAELEQAVRHLERENWELVMQDDAPTIQEALMITKGASSGRMGLSTQVCVPMKRELTAEEYATLDEQA